MSKSTNATPKPLSELRADIAIRLAGVFFDGVMAGVEIEAQPSHSYHKGPAIAQEIIEEVEAALKAQPAPRRFPILHGAPPSIPWDMIAPYEYYAQQNHHQSLKELAGRGGLDPLEALAVLTRRTWREVRGILDADEQLIAMVAKYEAAAQPAPVPLAEDEALIAEAGRYCEARGHGGLWPSRENCVCGLAERLSLRSGQLAQVLALCDDAESTKQAKECIAGGGVICIQVPEIRAAIEGSK